MKKKQLLIISTLLSLSLLSGCASTDINSANVASEVSSETNAETTAQKVTNESKEVSAESTETTTEDSRTPEAYNFLIRSKNETGYIDNSPNLNGDYEIETEMIEGDQFFNAFITWNLPLEIIADNAKTVTFASSQGFVMTGDYEDAIISCEEETLYERSYDDNDREFYSATFDYDKLVKRDYILSTRRVCQRGLFVDDYDNMFVETTDIDQKYFDFGGFIDCIVSVIVEYNDGSIRENGVFATLEYVDDNDNIVDQSSATDVAISITSPSDGIFLQSRPADGGDADTVYYGDTIVATVQRTTQTAGEEAIVEPEAEGVLIDIKVPNKNFTGCEDMESFTTPIYTCSLFVGRKIGDVIEDSGDYGDTGWHQVTTITGIK